MSEKSATLFAKAELGFSTLLSILKLTKSGSHLSNYFRVLAEFLVAGYQRVDVQIVCEGLPLFNFCR